MVREFCEMRTKKKWLRVKLRKEKHVTENHPSAMVGLLHFASMRALGA